MLRRFQTTTFRNQQELSGQYWDFSAPAGNVKKIYVPSCWENQPGLERFRGTCAYETTLQAQGNTRFVFKGVSFQAKVYLDGQPIGEHYNAYTPFACTVKDVPAGQHTLRVEVSNAFSEFSSLHVSNDYRSWGGITRGVVAESLGDAYIRFIHATPFRKNGVWHMAIRAQVENLSQAPMEAKVSLTLAGESLTLAPLALGADALGEISAEIACPQAKDYAPDSPVLYALHAALHVNGQPVDDLNERVGFREITVEGNRIHWNGKPFQIRGFNRHETHGLFGCALPVEAMVQDLNLIKDLNANAVRTCHYPNDELFLDLCDELGILVWEEGHARGMSVKQIENPYFRGQSLDCIHEMMENHHNHPSVFIWGCLNECPSDSDYGRECYKEQLEALKGLDGSRPITAASRYPGHSVFGENAPAREPLAPGMHDGDICLDLQDVVSFNIYPGWYVNTAPDGMMARLVDWVNEHGGKNKPFIISEIGAGAIYGFHSHALDKWSEERQVQVIEEALEAVFANPAFQGVFLWQFSDGLVDEDWAMGRPKTMNNKGVVDEFRRRKLSYDVVKRIFARQMGQ